MTRFSGLLLVALAALAILGAPRPAEGHAALVTSDPAANAFLQRAPGVIALSFSEPLDRRQSAIRLLDAGGQDVRLDSQDVSDNGLVLQAVLPSLHPGIYNVLWNNISTIDGHPLRGSYPFTVLNPDGSVPDIVNSVGGIEANADPPPEDDGVAVRALSLLGMVMTAAAAALLVIVSPPSPQLRRRASLVAFAGSLLLVAARLLNVFDLHDAFGTLGWQDFFLHTRTGGYWLVRMGAALLCAVVATFILEAPKRSAGGMAAGIAIYLVGLSLTSHAAAGTGSNWAIGFDYLHGVAAIAWMGAVLGLALAARMAGRSPRYRQVLPRFSLTASILVFVLLGSGLFNAFIEIDSPDALTGTRYGITLLLKLALIVPLLALAGYNARWGAKRLASKSPGEPYRFIRSATGEVFLGLAVFVLAATLTQTSVSKSVVETPDLRPFDQATTVGDLAVQLKIDPNRTGLNTYVAMLIAGGQPVDADFVRLTFRYQDDQTVGASTLNLASAGPGTYSGQGPYLTLEGQWRVSVEVRRPNADDSVAFFDVRPAGAPLAYAIRGGGWDNPAPGMSWNEFGGIFVLVVGLGLAIWGGRLGSFGRPAGWAANGMTALAFGVGALLLFGVHRDAPTGALPTNPIFPDANSVAIGRDLYQQNCIACHGQNGVPPRGLALSPYPLDLTVHVPQHPDGQIYNFIYNGVPGSEMAAWGKEERLTEDEIWHLVNFLRTLGAVDR